MKRRHHYVPQFYLRAFASAPRRINVFNLERGRAIMNASLRDQCHRHRLYGEPEDLENAFADFEGRTAPVLAMIAATRNPPQPGSQDHVALVAFVAMQLVRTTAARRRVKQGSDRLANAAFDGAPPPGFVPNQIQSMALALSTLPHMMPALHDLKAHAIIAGPGQQFVTSDNPGYRYNQYCEGSGGQGVTGVACRGLQVFLPVSPQVTVLLFDAGVYKVGKRGTAPSSVATATDVDAINLLQFITAENNVYFTRCDHEVELQNLAKKALKGRAAGGPRVQKAHEVGNEQSVLLHQYELMPDLDLRLSFVSVRRDARRIPLSERARKVRNRLPGLREPGPAHESSRTRVFRVRPHK